MVNIRPTLFKYSCVKQRSIVFEKFSKVSGFLEYLKIETQLYYGVKNRMKEYETEYHADKCDTDDRTVGLNKSGNNNYI